MKALWDAINALRQDHARLANRVPLHQVTGPSSFLARLTASTSVTSNRWKYSWQAVNVTGATMATVTDITGLVGPYTLTAGQTGWAWNERELVNNSGSTSGAGWETDQLSWTISGSSTVIKLDIDAIQELGKSQKSGGSTLHPIVRLAQYPDGTGGFAYLFSAMNVPIIAKGE